MLSGSSAYDTLFVAQVTVATIYFVFFTLYEALKEQGKLIKEEELNLMAFNMGYMIVALGALGTILFMQNNSSSIQSDPYTSQILLGISIFIVWFSMFLIFLQALPIYRRLRQSGESSS
jgi:small neutral amino acid transporter SnatA (MarC family)